MTKKKTLNSVSMLLIIILKKMKKLFLILIIKIIIVIFMIKRKFLIQVKQKNQIAKVTVVMKNILKIMIKV